MKLNEFPICTVAILLIHIIYILMYRFTGLLPNAPYGRHNFEELSAFQIDASPIFIHNSDKPFIAFIAQFFALFSPLAFDSMTGERTKVVFGISESILSVYSLIVLTLLFVMFRHVSRTDPRSNLKFAWNFIGLAAIIYCLRMLVGLGSYHLGRKIMPRLCFSDAMREVSKGFTPVLLAMYLVLQAKLSDDLIFTSVFAVTYSDFIFVLLCLPIGHTLWWNSVGLVVGLVFALLTCSYGASLYTPVDSSDILKTSSKRRRDTFKRFVVFMTITCFVYWIKLPSSFAGSHQLSTIGSSEDPLLTLIVMTAPRKNGANHLFQTVQSYLDAFPNSPRDPLYNRIKMVVFTHFTEHPVFDDVEQKIGSSEKSKNYIDWVRFPGSEFNQKKHFDAAIRHTVLKLHPTTFYFGIIEDDFPLCPGKWPEVLRLIRDANMKVPQHCGIFIGTGGAGLLIKRDKYEMILKEMHQKLAPDTAIHYCLKGSGCPGCELVVPSKMLLYHTGHASSTMGHKFRPDVYQCGARHPFIGDLDAIVL